jgi:DNA-binding CsgD family transcriptional regulator
MQKESGESQAIFIGRTAEISVIGELLDAARRGRGQVVAVSGEPGIGKTRLAKKAVEMACGLGFRVFWGRFHEGQYVPPYGPWKQIIRSLFADPGGSRTRSRLEALAGDLALLVPDLLPAAPGQRGRPRPRPEQVRVRLIEAITAALRESCTRVPALIVLDNLHCADGPSLELLAEIAAELADWKLLLLAAYRPPPSAASGPLAVALGALAAHDHFTPLRLGGLDLQPVRAYLRSWLGRAAPEGLVQAVHRRTEGNPLFVSEVVKLLGRQGLLEQDAAGSHGGWETHVPDRLLLAINGRVERLSASCRELLAAAAVIGREFDLSVLQDLRRPSDPGVGAGVEEAVSNWIIEEAAGQEGRYRFSHALVHEALASRVSATRKARLRWAIGKALERRFGGDAMERCGELAPYFDCGLAGAAAKAVRYRKGAGELACSLCAFEDARMQFGRALAICDEATDDRVKAEICQGLARSFHGLADFRISMEYHTRAFESFVRAGDIRSAIRGLRQPYVLSTWGPDMTRLLERAIALAGARSAEAERLGFHYALAVYHDTGQAETACHLLERTLARARRDGDLPLEAWTLTNWSHVLLDEMDYPGAQEMTERAIAACSLQREYWAEATARSQHMTALLGQSRFGLAQEEAAGMGQLSERMHSRFWATLFSIQHCFLRWQLADLAGMRRLLPSLVGADSPVVLRWALVARVLVEYGQGNAAEGCRHLRDVMEQGPLPRDVISLDCSSLLLVPYIAWLTGDVSLLERMADIPAPEPVPDHAGRVHVVGASAARALAAVVRGDRAAASGLYLELLPCAGLVLRPGLGLNANHLLGQLALLAGEPEQAKRHFQVAADSCRKTGAAMDLALTCLDLAGLLCDNGTPADRSSAAALHEEARRIARKGGVVLLERRLAELGRRIGAPPGVAPAGRSTLTPREAEVLRLLAEGLANEQVGARLYISPRTVANHVQRILEKTGSANRTEAAVYAVRHGLADAPVSGT